MSKSKLTLIVDGNWLLMSRLSVLNNKYSDDYALCHDLQLMLIQSMSIVLRTFPHIDNIIFVTDGGSWRNKLELPDYLKDEHIKNGVNVEYKGTREKSSNFNWDLLFSSYEDFISILNSTGITACKEQNVEGDDWCWHWSKFLNSEGTNCIIWSKDNDLKQLVSVDSNKCFTVWWNKENGIFAEESASNAKQTDMDFFFNPHYSQNEDIFNSIQNKAKSVNFIDPKSIVIDKIIRGDGSDNILPIILRKSKTNSSKKFKVSAKDLPEKLDYNDKNKVKEYITNLLSLKNYANRVEKTADEVFKHFEYNKRLVVLEEQSYPKEILEKLNNYTEYNCSKDINEAKQQITSCANKLNSILDII